MKILTFNLWHGLARTGRVRLKSAEAPGKKDLRLNGFLRLARDAQPDLILVQEANPAQGTARRIASFLGMNEIHKVSNAGMKFVIGFPPSYRSGLVILARKELGLKRIGAFKLPGSGFGRTGDRFSFQLSEHRYALAGRIQWEGRPLVLVNAHLHHTLPLDHATRDKLNQARRRGLLSSEENRRIVAQIDKLVDRRRAQVRFLADSLRDRFGGSPVILGGDFNADPDSPKIRELLARGFLDTFALKGTGPGHTWDPGRNGNAKRSAGAFMSATRSNKEIRDILASRDLNPRRIDYIFLNKAFAGEQVLASELFAVEPLSRELHCSDHFGVLTTIEFRNEWIDRKL